MNEPLLLDYETRSRVNLPKTGHHEYVRDCEILMVGVARGVEEPPQVAPCVAPNHGPFVSWGNFDYEVYRNVERRVNPLDWTDAMHYAMYLGMPAGLNAFCQAIGIDAKKDPRGSRLIKRYSLPQPDGSFLELADFPDDHLAMIHYCLIDVVLLQKAWKVLQPFQEEWEKIQRPHAEVVARMNDRGIPVDRAAVIKAQALIDDQEFELKKEFHELVGFYPNQAGKLHEYLGTRDCTRGTLEAATFDDPDKQRARDIRLTVSKAAAKKLGPMKNMSGVDGRVHGSMVFNGAHTGRGSSRGVQFQNMKRSRIDLAFFDALHRDLPVEDPIGQTQQNIRGFIWPGKHERLVVVDYAQIEARIVAWVAGEEALMTAFMDATADPYKMLAGVLVNKKWRDVDGDERNLGKLGILASGYGVSGGGLARQAPGYGLDIGEAAGWEVVNTYRRLFPRVVETWSRLEDGVRGLLAGTRRECSVGPCVYTLGTNFLKLHLPSGRVIRYFRPHLGPERFGRAQICYTRRLGYTMTDGRLWGGHMLENIAQAIAADIKADAMLRIDRGLAHAKLLFEVHDEVVMECPDHDADYVLHEACSLMRQSPDWFKPGLLDVEGSIMERYSK